MVGHCTKDHEKKTRQPESQFYLKAKPSTINQYFKEINTEPAYSIPQRIPIPPGTRIPALEAHTVQGFLAQQKRTAPGPDGLPHWMWRDFSHLLAPRITKLFSRSLQEQFCPVIGNLPM